MSHHGPNPFENFQPKDDETTEQARQRSMRALLDTTGFKGALGAFPEGKLTKDDEGAIQFRVGSEGSKVVLDFGTQVQWVGMSAQQAAELASSLMKWARLVGRKNGETVVLNLDAT